MFCLHLSSVLLYSLSCRRKQQPELYRPTLVLECGWSVQSANLQNSSFSFSPHHTRPWRESGRSTENGEEGAPHSHAVGLGTELELKFLPKYFLRVWSSILEGCLSSVTSGPACTFFITSNAKHHFATILPLRRQNKAVDGQTSSLPSITLLRQPS